MHALVLWTETQQISVVPDGHLRGGNDGEAKWGGKFYPVQVLMKSANEAWLDSLHVSLDGTILPPEDHCSKLLEKRKMQQNSEKPSKKTSQESKNKYKASILGSSSIFEAKDVQLSPKPVNIRSTISGEGLSLTCNNGVSPSLTSEACSSKGNSRVVQTVDADGSKQVVSQFPGISPEDMATIHSFLATIISQTLEEKKEEATGKKKGDQKKCTKSIKNELVPLFEGSNVLLPKLKIETLLDSCQKKPRDLVRKLMIAILGKETLKKSSPPGKGGWTPIPTNILEDVESFVRQNTKKKYRITHDQYTRCLTAQCASLRVPDKNLNIEGDEKRNKRVIKSSVKTKVESDGEESSESGELGNGSDSSQAELNFQDKKLVEKREVNSKKFPKSSSTNLHEEDYGEKNVTPTYLDKEKDSGSSKQISGSLDGGSSVDVEVDLLGEMNSETKTNDSESIPNSESRVDDGFQKHSEKSVEDEEVIEKVSNREEKNSKILNQDLEDISELELRRHIEELEKLLQKKKKRGSSEDNSQEPKKSKK
ncbi:hypothetical protein QAD02_010521 [Eretmocerus hayati]|uniref:Uncharacterized protein n=1 Tax=Eretmocerus hayati TaxID=131215 RepID=A0ACC2NU77_9HYME|nr:hypothetical protein QAD02_010521 [Eretmocerus hayati]